MLPFVFFLDIKHTLIYNNVALKFLWYNYPWYGDNMKIVKIDFQITSLDSNNHFQTTGEYKNNRIKFLDPEGNMNYIIFQNNIVEYYKKGTIDMKYKFDLKQQTIGYYKAYGQQFDFTITTKHIEHNQDYLKIYYELYQNNTIVNKTNIQIEYTTLKEE